jgi:hypothetical protein
MKVFLPLFGEITICEFWKQHADRGLALERTGLETRPTISFCNA